MLARNVIESFSGNTFNITLVDIDGEMTKTAKTNNILLDLNKKSLLNKNVKIINNDAFKFISDLQKDKSFN
jgi:predicted membrane-bound spermidine synthase